MHGRFVAGNETTHAETNERRCSMRRYSWRLRLRGWNWLFVLKASTARKMPKPSITRRAKVATIAAKNASA